MASSRVFETLRPQFRVPASGHSMRRRQRFAAVIPACVRLSRSDALAAAIFYTYASESRRRSPTCTPERSAACRLLHLLQLGSRDDALRGRRDDEYLVVFSPRAVAAGVVAIIHLEECAAAARRRHIRSEEHTSEL